MSGARVAKRSLKVLFLARWHVGGAPFAKVGLKSLPFALGFSDKDDIVDRERVLNPHSVSLSGQMRMKVSVWPCCYYIHNRYLAEIATQWLC